MGWDTLETQEIGEFFHQRRGELGCSRAGKGWPASFVCVSIERELRDNDGFTTILENGQVEFASLILEDAQGRDLFSQDFGLRLAVTLTDSKQDDQPGTDPCDGMVIYTYFPVFDSLQKRAHGIWLGDVRNEKRNALSILTHYVSGFSVSRQVDGLPDFCDGFFGDGPGPGCAIGEHSRHHARLGGDFCAPGAKRFKVLV